MWNEARDAWQWLQALDPTFKFLLGLPFLVAVAGLLGDWLHARFGKSAG